jgi:predicted amidohydrolase YtcJ
LGDHEKIAVEDALKAVTVDAAFQLHLDHEIGSIEAGKKADFAILEEDPLAVDPMQLRDIKVWGTVLAGQKFQASTHP